MTIEDSIKQLVETSLKRVEASIIASATRQLERPSTRLRPKLEQLEALPEGAAAYAWFDPEGATRRKYDAYAFKPWCASYGGVVAYGTTPDNALDEFDHLMTRGPGVSR